MQENTQESTNNSSLLIKNRSIVLPRLNLPQRRIKKYSIDGASSHGGRVFRFKTSNKSPAGSPDYSARISQFESIVSFRDPDQTDRDRRQSHANTNIMKQRWELSQHLYGSSLINPSKQYKLSDRKSSQHNIKSSRNILQRMYSMSEASTNYNDGIIRSNNQHLMYI